MGPVEPTGLASRFDLCTSTLPSPSMRVLLPLFLLASWIGGCTSAPDSTPPATPPSESPPSESRSVPPPADTADATPRTDTLDAAWTDGPVNVEHPTDEATLQAVRSAAHDGFDRVVFEFAEAALPSYHIAVPDDPVRQCGSGRPISLSGNARLQIRFDRTRAHTNEGTPTVTDRERSPDLPRLRTLTLTCDFEGMVEWAFGLATPGPFRVTELSAPTRLVVDLR